MLSRTLITGLNMQVWFAWPIDFFALFPGLPVHAIHGTPTAPPAIRHKCSRFCCWSDQHSLPSTAPPKWCCRGCESIHFFSLFFCNHTNYGGRHMRYYLVNLTKPVKNVCSPYFTVFSVFFCIVTLYSWQLNMIVMKMSHYCNESGCFTFDCNSLYSWWWFSRLM